MIAAIAVGSQLPLAQGEIVVMVVAAAGLCFTWPSLEALVSEGESRAGVQHMVGIYNAVWAATGAVAYFTGGAMLDQSLQSLFYVPLALVITELALAYWLADRRAGPMIGRAASVRIHRILTGERPWQQPRPAERGMPLSPLGESHPHSSARTRSFLLMAWLANPFAYIGINTLIAVMPGIALRLDLSTMLAGFWGSLGVLPD